MLRARSRERSGPLPACVYDRTVKSVDLLRELERQGWTLDRVRGSHQLLVHPLKPGHISVPHPRKDLGRGLVNRVRKQGPSDVGTGA